MAGAIHLWQALAISKDSHRLTTVRIGRFWYGLDGVVQQECSKTPSKPYQNLPIRTVVSRCVSFVIARACQRWVAPAIPVAGVHTAGVAGSNPAAPTMNFSSASGQAV